MLSELYLVIACLCTSISIFVALIIILYHKLILVQFSMIIISISNGTFWDVLCVYKMDPTLFHLYW